MAVIPNLNFESALLIRRRQKSYTLNPLNASATLAIPTQQIKRGRSLSPVPFYVLR
jgi:uncharacterized membrane-anchored protein